MIEKRAHGIFVDDGRGGVVGIAHIEEPRALGGGEHVIEVEAMIGGERHFDGLDVPQPRIGDDGFEGWLSHHRAVPRRAEQLGDDLQRLDRASAKHHHFRVDAKHTGDIVS